MRATSLFALNLLVSMLLCAPQQALARQGTGQATQQTSPASPSPTAEQAPANASAKTANEAPATIAARKLPAKVTLAGGSRIDVALETPLSTRIAKKDQEVVFRAAQPIALGDGLELSGQTAFIGIVTEVKRPGAFGRQGALKVELKRINLPSGADAVIVARLDSPDMRGKGRLTSDSQRGTDVMSLATWTLTGAVIGGHAAGGKGAGYGAVSGAAIWLITKMSHHGADVYLEPGMPFTVLMDEPVELPGSTAIFSADNPTGQSSSSSAYPGSDIPHLTHRPKP
jgi:hypothetical protein